MSSCRILGPRCAEAGGDDDEAPNSVDSLRRLTWRGHGAEPRGALLVLQEYWGLNDWVKHQADQLAKEGYLAWRSTSTRGKSRPRPPRRSS